MILQQGALSKTNPIINEGSVIAQVSGADVIFCCPKYPYPDTPFRRNKGYNSDMYFDSTTDIPDLKLNKVNVVDTIDIRAFLEGNDPEGTGTYAETLNIDLNNDDTDAELLAQFPEGYYLEIVNATFEETLDPYITTIFDELAALYDPIDEVRLSTNPGGELNNHKREFVSEVMVFYLQNRDTPLVNYYLGDYNLTLELKNKVLNLL